MTIKTRVIGYVTAATLAVALVVGSAAAQTANDKAIAKAVALEKSVSVWLDTPQKWPSLVRALEQAAKLRGAEDPEAIKDLLYSANVRLQLGDAARAQSQFVQAADWALAVGDVETAATGYVRAALVAARMKDAASAHEYRDKAVRLARSPLLNAVQRQAILKHFADTAQMTAGA